MNTKKEIIRYVKEQIKNAAFYETYYKEKGLKKNSLHHSLKLNHLLQFCEGIGINKDETSEAYKEGKDEVYKDMKA
tara:strand:- start:202 stop:429 length:228 start_codon:yes stop_codon:yes gene_type:complete